MKKLIKSGGRFKRKRNGYLDALLTRLVNNILLVKQERHYNLIRTKDCPIGLTFCQIIEQLSR